MATEYKCDICGKPATVHITKIVNGKKMKVHLCSECAEKASLDSASLPADLFPNLKDFDMMMTSEIVKVNECSKCGASLVEIEKGARFSCPSCYSELGRRLLEIFSNLQAGTQHKGKSPKNHAPNVDISFEIPEGFEPLANAVGDTIACELGEIISQVKAKHAALKKNLQKAKQQAPQEDPEETRESLQKKLDAALSEERYEDAAALRDKIKSISEHNK